MDTSLLNCIVPQEIIRTIFSYLTDKKDKGNCFLVCKLWNSVACGLFGDEIRFKVKISDCDKFSMDLLRYPTICSKVKHLTFVIFAHGRRVGQNTSELRSVVNKCYNLTDLVFTSYKVHNYLQVLNCNRAALPNIYVNNLEKNSSSAKRLFLSINFRYRNTISSLIIADLGDSDALQDYGGLSNYIPLFPSLKCLQVQCDTLECIMEARRTIDLDALIKSGLKLENPRENNYSDEYRDV